MYLFVTYEYERRQQKNNNKCVPRRIHSERERAKKKSQPQQYLHATKYESEYTCSMFILSCLILSRPIPYRAVTNIKLFVCVSVFFLAIGRRWKLHMTTSWMNSVSDEIQCISAPNFFLISLSPTIKYASFDDPKQIKWLHMEMDGRKFPKHHRKQFRRHNTLQSAQMTRSHKMVLVRKLCSFLHIAHLYMARITLWGIPQCQMMFGMVCLCCWPFFRHSVRENRQK